MAYIVMAYVVMAYMVMAHMVMAYVVMAYIVMVSAYPVAVALISESVRTLVYTNGRHTCYAHSLCPSHMCMPTGRSTYETC